MCRIYAEKIFSLCEPKKNWTGQGVHGVVLSGFYLLKFKTGYQNLHWRNWVDNSFLLFYPFMISMKIETIILDTHANAVECLSIRNRTLYSL